MDNKTQGNLPNKSNNKKTILMIVLAVVLAALMAGLAVWVWQSQKNDAAKKDSDSRIKELEGQTASSETQASEKSSEDNKATESKDENPEQSPSQKTISAIQKATDSNDYTGLKPFFADKMLVVTGGAGGSYDTPDERVPQIMAGYFESVTGPWDFTVKAEDINNTADNQKQFINDKMYYGVSSGKYGERGIVSFKIDNQGKIRTFYRGLRA